MGERRQVTAPPMHVEGNKTKSGTGGSLHTQEPVTVASFRTWRVGGSTSRKTDA
jgi:hypothetical protein